MRFCGDVKHIFNLAGVSLNFSTIISYAIFVYPSKFCLVFDINWHYLLLGSKFKDYLT